MAIHRKTEKLFLLKDMLFNEAKVRMLAAEIQAVYPNFAKTAFIKKVVSAFPGQELMELIGPIITYRPHYHRNARADRNNGAYKLPASFKKSIPDSDYEKK